jgi:hypothetical protein
VSDQGLSVPPQPLSGQSPQGGYPQDPGGPPGPLDPPPQKQGHWVRNTLLGVLGLAVIVVVIVVATSGGGSAAPSGSSATFQAGGRAPGRHAPGTGVGATFAARTGHGTYHVRLDLIIDPAQAAGQSAAPRHGTRLIGAVFTVAVLRGSLRNANAPRDAAVVASDGKTYRPVAGPIAGYTGFRPGRVSLARGGSATGAVTFELPAGVTVTTVTWSAGSGPTLRWPVR